jgi:two-component SAPR family response regulator
LRKAAGIGAGVSGNTLERAIRGVDAESSVQAGTPRSRVIATIHTDQVLVFQGGSTEGPTVIGTGIGVGDLSFREAPTLQIHALGGGRIVRDGQPCEWRGAMTKELFFYILLHGPLERDAIGVVFWPDLSAQKVANNFHYAISQIRRAIGADAVVVEGGQYQIGEDYWFDVEGLESVVERARLLSPYDSQAEGLWKRAVTLYQGDFLPEVERTWCVPKREALREIFLESLVGVGQCHESRGELEGAIGWYRRVLEIDELREDVHRHVIRCYAEAGRRSDAVAQYQRCQEILRQELGLEPSAETAKLYEQVSSGRRQES